jgi:hypothetical protein
MLPQARPLLFAVYLAAVALILAIILGLSPQIVWQRVDPVGYGVWRIEHAEIFAAPYRNDAGRLEEAVPAWRVVMRSSAAGHLLTDLARRTNPITRLYALAGLTLRDSPAADSLRRALLRDTTLIPVQRPCQESRDLRHVSEIARLIGSREFAQSLLNDDGTCR